MVYCDKYEWMDVARMRTFLPVLVFFLFVLVSVLWREQTQRKRLRLRIQKFYASQLFEDMMPQLRFSKKQQIEQVTVDKTGVVFRYLHLRNNESAFLMRPHGYRYLTPEQQEALRAVLEECLPQLQDQKRYHLVRHRVRLLNGEVEYVYQYTIANAYKAALMRAPYYDGTLKPHLW